jgi:hypothetical protein
MAGLDTFDGSSGVTGGTEKDDESSASEPIGKSVILV